MIQPIGLGDLTGDTLDGWAGELSGIFAVQSPDFPARIRKTIGTDFSPHEIIRLSERFVESRLNALGTIRPSSHDSAPAKVLFLPVHEPTASATPWQDGYLAVVTAGLLELLQTHGIASVWANRLSDVERHLGQPLPLARRARDYINLRSLLYFCGHPPLLNLSEVVPDELRDMGMRIAELACLFIILHEYGHACYGTLAKGEKDAFASRVQTQTPEELNPWKLEEFFADQYAVRCLEPGLAEPAVHASLLFFSLLAFAESHALIRSDRHPTATNRLAALIAYSAQRAGTPSAHLTPPARQLDRFQRMRTTAHPASALSPEKIRQMEMVADLMEKDLNWREAVASICVLHQELLSG